MSQSNLNVMVEPLNLEKKARKIRVKHQRTSQQTIILGLSLATLFIISWLTTPMNFDYLTTGAQKINGILTQFIHPDWTALPNFLKGLIETVAIGYVGLLTSLFFAVPLSFFVAQNTTPSISLAKGIRVVLSFIRAVPITIWGLIGAASIGFGSQAGVLGLFLPTTSYLIRVLSERIEEGGTEIVESLTACGAPWTVIMAKGVFIQLLPQFISVIMLRFEMTISETIALGMVGIAGIGYTLNMSIGTYKFSIAIVGIIVIYCTMLLIETASRQLVSRIRKDS